MALAYALLCFMMAFMDLAKSERTHMLGKSYSTTRFKVPRTVASPWPMPFSYTTTNVTMQIDAETFYFEAIGQTCDILESAFVRYHGIIFGDFPSRVNDAYKIRDNTLKFQPKAEKRDRAMMLNRLEINILYPCEVYPSLEMDESYLLVISATDAYLDAYGIWGALRGLETFSQIIYRDAEEGLVVNFTSIRDKPRFAWRGILLDTARHYISVDTILHNLDAMAYNKINVFHWHIVDDESFPYQSRDFANMSFQGAFDPYTHVYTQADIRRVIEHARLRGIRVVPEFDTPGHSNSWGLAITNLLTPCYSVGKFDGTYGPVNPALQSTYTFMMSFIRELTEVFKDNYLHLGGDEVHFDCWKSNPNVTAFMTAMGFGTNYALLESYYMQKLLDIVSNYTGNSVVWQEVFDNGVKVHPDTVIEVWIDSSGAETARVTAAGLKAILASPWYLDYISVGPDWKNYYKVEPTAFNGTAEQKALVIGGEACLWGEDTDATNVESRLWPRASAVAERLWSPMDVTDLTSAAARIEEHRCRMLRRGINAEPANGPSYCPHEAVIHY